MLSQGLFFRQDHFVHRWHAGQVSHSMSLDGLDHLQRIEAGKMTSEPPASKKGLTTPIVAFL